MCHKHNEQRMLQGTWYGVINTCCAALPVWSRYRPGVAQRVGRSIALLFHNRSTRRGWGVSSIPWPLFTPQERPGTHFTGGWVGPRAGLDGGKSHPHWNSILDHPARSQSLYRLTTGQLKLSMCYWHIWEVRKKIVPVFLPVVLLVKCWMFRQAVVKLVIVKVIQILKKEVCIIMAACCWYLFSVRVEL